MRGKALFDETMDQNSSKWLEVIRPESRKIRNSSRINKKKILFKCIIVKILKVKTMKSYKPPRNKSKHKTRLRAKREIKTNRQ